MKFLTAVIFFLIVPAWGDGDENTIAKDAGKNDSTVQEYKIEKPGTITFTVGARIKGKVEKPQVMIFLPKEKIQYREIVLERTFMEDLYEPLPFVPLVK